MTRSVRRRRVDGRVEMLIGWFLHNLYIKNISKGSVQNIFVL